MSERTTGLDLARIAVALLAILALGAAASAQDWEMRVCADPDGLPFSHRDGSGFENRIAEILADELGARLGYVWFPQGSQMIDTQLREGNCDVIMGIPDGYDGLLNTVAYYRSPYTFVHRADAPFEIGSLDDPLLQDLDIGVQSGGIPPHDALVARGLGSRVTFHPGRHVDLASVVEAVARGEVDVGLAWGPVAAYYAARQPVELEVVPVTPEFEPPARAMVLPMTIGLRHGDDAFRDRLGAALAARWEEVQEVLEEYGVPLAPLPRPSVPPAPVEGATRVGLVSPTATGLPLVQASLYDVVGEAARMGALLAEAELQARTDATGAAIELVPASSPSAGAAVRAAERLISTEAVDAIVGGLGEGQAQALAAWAEERSLPFLNIGSPDEALRDRCYRSVFHVQASAGTYLDALVARGAADGRARWFVIHEQGAEGERLAAEAAASVAEEGAGGTVVGSAAVAREQPTYFDVLDEAREAGADAILLLLGAGDQIVFLSQLAQHGADVAIAPFPAPVTQTRDYLAAARLRTGGGPGPERIALWDPALATPEADALNERFASRWGEPLEPSAWAAYAAVRIVGEAADAAGSTDASAFAAYLLHPRTQFELGKGSILSFRAQDHQLVQPLYAIRSKPEAEWGRAVTARIDIAEVVGVVPARDGAEGDTSGEGEVGDGSGAEACRR